jgi:hypothetical protein
LLLLHYLPCRPFSPLSIDGSCFLSSCSSSAPTSKSGNKISSRAQTASLFKHSHHVILFYITFFLSFLFHIILFLLSFFLSPNSLSFSLRPIYYS